jgi:hypothetical protein
MSRDINLLKRRRVYNKRTLYTFLVAWKQDEQLRAVGVSRMGEDWASRKILQIS